tara:strand:+ start:473 stop:742 length:270 start_codon:yes stop_codon:yes gene_type:complete
MTSDSKFSSSGEKARVKTKSLILLNDDFNDFDHIIECLILVCNHTYLQAEQCAIITHYTGRCVIKKGSFMELLNFKKDLTLFGIDLEIE